MDTPLLVAALRAAPNLLRALGRDCSTDQAWRAPAPGEWSVGEVVRHLVHGERDTFLPRLRRMLAEDRPRFDPRSPGGADPADLATLLAAFERARTQSAAILADLDPAGWRREGLSPSRGLLTIAEYARTMSEHDTEHLRQIQAVREHLGMLPRRAESRQALPLPQIVAAIRQTPARLAALADGLTAEQLRRRPRDGEWSMKEVMAHLLKVERDVFLPRLRRTAAEERPVFQPFDPDAWAAERDHREGRFDEDHRQFGAVREQTVAFLESLSPAAAERIALSGFFGPLTLGQYATHVVDHDLEHLTQMAASRPAVAAPGR